ncbi:MAG: Type 1 glutamine amidotransferase-like domain-containing protein, partial [Candidatus Limnocylindrales bacterium]
MATGPLVLHGGGEAMPGDEPVAIESFRIAPAAAGEPLRVVIVPLATARGNPGRTTAHVSAFLSAVARDQGTSIQLATAQVVDRASANDPRVARTLTDADLIVIPGGDPDIMPTTLPRTAAWREILGARQRGAVIWGASAGAMALAKWCWTPDGGMPGLSLVPGLVVAPHVTDPSATAWLDRLGGRPAELGILTLAEQTAIVGPLDPVALGTAKGTTRRCVGAGAAAWI